MRDTDPAQVLDRFPGLRVLVVGDLVLDEWLEGASTRLCREAPVPVVDVERTRAVPGCAANVAANAAALGAGTRVLGLVGDDRDGGCLRRTLREAGADPSGIVTDAGHRTTAKRRLLSDGQVIARFDQQDHHEWAPATVRALADRVRREAPRHDLVLVGDYGDASAGDAVRRALCEVRDRLRGPLLADAHDLQPWRPCRPTAVTPSAAEALALLHREDAPRRALLDGERSELPERAGADMVAVTLDADGTVLHWSGPTHRTRPARASRHTTGAGDTFVAAFGLALAAGAAPPTAADLAQSAADVVVAEPETTVCSRTDLVRRCSPRPARSVLTADEVHDLVERCRARGELIGFTNGCFDVMHAGHAAYLEQAAALVDILVVGVNSDASVRRLKGPDRPVLGERERVRLLGALTAVDAVTVFDGDSPTALIERIHPDLYVKGGDYTPEMLPETPLVRRLGGEVRVVDYVAEHSTTHVIDRIRVGAGATP
ncbi:MAG TPA: D-glycero-beta-D-manno-heptose 1-phosphate adenylyltransferase [Segeticoccus sp.]|nr:D-glycero-beta-D-manno-heptose 1-phosphate adenylyltransferase [Segeticoccus sp.]